MVICLYGQYCRKRGFFLNKRELQREGTLGLIYDTVNQLVQEKGFDAMRIKDICERANISTGAFYHHFPSKQDILYERYHTTHRFMLSLYEDAQQMPILEALQYLTRELTEYTRSRVPSVLISYQEASLRLKDDWRKRENGMSLYRVAYNLLTRARERGEIDDRTSVEDVAMAVCLFQRGLTSEQCFSDGAFLAGHRPEDMFCRILETMVFPIQPVE